WKCLWRKSPCFNHMNQINPNLLQHSFVKLTADFPKRLTGLYIALRTGHAPLNQHLHCIFKAESPHCPHCRNTEETIFHFLIICPQYQHECHTLINALGHKAMSIPFLLSSLEATPHLVQYVNTTRRMNATFGEVPPPEPPVNR
ncbi:hypothetical protein BDR04DRAFT_1029051, partial [Suillus decipiens]